MCRANQQDPYLALKESPLFNLSLASKELFHSNFIAWYAENFPKNFVDFINENGICDVCFNDAITEDGKWRTDWKILRESNNYDVCIKDDKGYIRLVIENKVKSIPYKEQLDGYKQEIQKSIITKDIKFRSKLFRNNKDDIIKYLLTPKNDELTDDALVNNDDINKCKNHLSRVAYILLSLSKVFPDIKDVKQDGWKVINYSNLAEFLAKKYSNDNLYESHLIRDYISVISNLDNLEGRWANELMEQNIYSSLFLLDFNTENKAPSDGTPKNENTPNEYQRAKAIRIHDLYGKTRAQRICMLLDKQLRDQNIIDVTVEWGFTNGTPLLQAKKTIKTFTDDEGRDELLIQIQGNQYRHAVILVRNKVGYSCYDKKKNKIVITHDGMDYIQKNYNSFYNIFNNNLPKSLMNSKKIKDCCQYGNRTKGGGFCSFVYNYKNIEPNASVESILEVLVNDIDNNLSKFPKCTTQTP